VGRIIIGKLAGVREDENGDSKNWGRHGNLDLQGRAFDRFTKILTYKAKVEGIEVVEIGLTTAEILEVALVTL
jgi:putative transposase